MSARVPPPVRGSLRSPSELDGRVRSQTRKRTSGGLDEIDAFSESISDGISRSVRHCVLPPNQCRHRITTGRSRDLAVKLSRRRRQDKEVRVFFPRGNSRRFQIHLEGLTA